MTKVVNEHWDFTKKFENDYALQFHKFSHQSKMMQIHVQKVNEKPQTDSVCSADREKAIILN